MPTEIKMPALSPTMEEGTLAKWLVKAGDNVKSGDILAEIETDKATMEFEAVDEGVIASIDVAEGTDGVKVGTVIATITSEGDDAAPSPPRGEGRGEGLSSPQAGDRDGPSPQPSPQGGEEEGVAPMPSDQGTEDFGPSPDQETGTTQLVQAADPAPVADPEIPAGTETVKLTVREALRDAMAEEMRRDPAVFVIGEEVAQYQGAYKVTQGLLDEFGDGRVIDTPITEYGFAGVGTGAAMGGLRPIVEFMTFNFALQAIDHIINSAAKTNYMSGGQMRCPMVFRGPNGAATRVAAQHSQNFAPWYASVPGLIVIAPYDAADAKGLLKAAIRTDDPVVFLENELLYGRSFDVPVGDDHVLPVGKARIVRPGADVTIVSYSIGVGVSLEAAERLASEGIEAEVIDLRTLRPLDRGAVLKSLARTNRVVVVEEGWPTCSIASEIMALCMEDGFDDLDAPVIRVCDEDVPLPYAANLEKLALIDSARVVEAVRKVCYRN
ncbi:pyruvate dehydrogenase complex E1 component subunit beta [uncultured Sphingomonas sp.]|uniref:pyruvate dehydrogenase complex E1 component subunit beta n=1 Tax=uncultured Sphingomonas sp. TaxID=158754 RepID=UPI0035C9B9C9